MFSQRKTPVLLLRGAAVVFSLLGLGLIIWLVDKAIRYPSINAAQFGQEAPLWIPFILFVLVCTAAAAILFFRAARRMAAGEDLFQQRHRRRPGEEA